MNCYSIAEITQLLIDYLALTWTFFSILEDKYKPMSKVVLQYTI